MTLSPNDLTDPRDHILITRFKNGEPSVFEEIINRYQDRVYSLCLRILGNSHDAEDAAQDSFLKAFHGLNRFQPDASLYTWLYRIAVNTCLDYKRKPVFESLFKKNDEGETLAYDLPSEQPSPERLAESRQLDVVLQASLGKLSQKLRTVIVLKEIEGLSYEEIAEILDISVGTVKSRISRARDELQEMMKNISC